MGRAKGSLSTPAANEMSKLMEILGAKDSKDGINYMRMIELIICYNVVEALYKMDDDKPIEEKSVTVEIPLLGNLKIMPRQFHERHRLSESPSVHLDFEFTPTSGFKVDLIKIYSKKNYDIAELFSTLYSERLKELYNKLCGE